MKRAAHRLITSLLMLGAIYSMSTAAVVFTDTFSTGASSSNWVKEFGTVTASVAGGAFRLTNTGANLALYTHSDTHTTFTLSARIKALSTSWDQDGLMVCWKGASYNGYMLVLRPDQGIVILKMTGGATKALWGSWYAAINPNDNVLSVSHQGSTFSFFCNGVFLHSITDNTYSSGSIGLLVNALNDVQFDDVVLTDTYKTPDTLRYFTDNFSSGNANGWCTSEVKGALDMTQGTLSVANDTVQSVVFVEGAFKDKPVHARIRFKAGDTTGYYGLLLMEVHHIFDTTGGSYYVDPQTWTGFFLNMQRSYGVGLPGSSWTASKSEKIHGGNDWDTVTITADYHFLVNGDTLPLDAAPYIWNTNAIGLFSDKGMTVEFDDFAAGDSTPLPVKNVLIPRKSGAIYSLAMPQHDAFFIDPLGRRIGRSNELSLRNIAGSYLIMCTHTANGPQLITKGTVLAK